MEHLSEVDTFQIIDFDMIQFVPLDVSMILVVSHTLRVDVSVILGLLVVSRKRGRIFVLS